MLRFARVPALFVCIVGIAGTMGAQNHKNGVPLSASARLKAAKTAYVTTVSGTDIPYKVITSALEAWGRFTLVNAPEKADIILEISAPDAGGVSVTSSTSALHGAPERTTKTTREISRGPVRLIVYDSRSRMALWAANEQTKFAVKHKTREDNVVEAAQRLVSKFRQRVEPAPTE